MKSSRSVLLLASAFLVLMLIVGGVVVRVGAGDSTYGQARLFSEVLSHVLDHYVDPVEADRLLSGAYEGMLGGLDANGAFLSPEEVRAWKAPPREDPADPGLSVLKAGRSLQVVALVPGSAAAEAGVKVGDQIRSVDDQPVRDLSLGQAWRLILGPASSIIKLDVLHPADGYRRERIDVVRTVRRGEAYEITEQDGTAVLRIFDMSRVPTDVLAARLEKTAARGSQLILDLRNSADMDPRQAAAVAGLFTAGGELHLRDYTGKIIDSLRMPSSTPVWKSSVGVIVNGATAGSAEALTRLLQDELDATIVGESTYGLGAEPELFELENGSGILVSSSLWETGRGQRWNGDGIEPDEVIRGTGTDYESVASDQLKQAIEFLRVRKPAQREAA